MQEVRRDQVQANGASRSFWDEKKLLQKIVSIAPSVLYIFNPKTQENEFVNDSLGAFLGYSVDELAAMGAEFMPLICHPEDLPRLHLHFQRIHTMGDGEVCNVEYRMKHKNGSWRWMLSHDAVFDRDADGSVARLLGAATDITDRKNAEESALAEKRAADAANEELRSFAYSMSHDMKAPTNTLKLLLSELRGHGDTALDAEGSELVDLSLEIVERMQALVEDVLGYTRIVGSDRVFEEVALGPLVADLLQVMAADIKAAGARIEVGDLPKVQGNPVQLRVYLQNILANALKYRDPSRDLLVQIKATRPPNGERVLVGITDNGLGIAPDHHARIFGMFKRLHLETEIPGTGLGLALCKRVALHHGGDIKVTSALGEGTCFTIDLPGL